MSDRLRSGLRELGEQMPPARLATDPWRVGRRQRRWARLATGMAVLVAVLVLTVSVPFWLGPGGSARYPVADGEVAVPAQVNAPWMWQATVEQSPAGPAVLLFSGGGSLGLRGSDWFDHEGKVAVVGTDGSYRTLLYGGAETVAGEDVRISPDGRYVAHDYHDGWLVVTDLVDGRSRSFRGPDGATCCGWPVAWAPDGGAVLALDYPRDGGELDPATGSLSQPARLVLLDLTTGATRVLLAEVGDRWGVRTASLAAFSPDGRFVAVSVDERLVLLDRDGRTVWTRDLGPRRMLGGAGAFSPDGRRITTVTLDGCVTGCDHAALAARTWRFDYLDPTTGSDISGPELALVRGLAVRALGWRHGTDLVALRYQPEEGPYPSEADWNDTGYWEVGHVELIAVGTDGQIETLLDPPRGVVAMDVPLNLLTAGRFGGPPTEPAPFPARPLILLAVGPLAGLAGLLLAAVAMLIWWLRYRRRLVPATRASRVRRPEQQPPGRQQQRDGQ